MSISSAINAARSGLQINGLRADIVATNVANATTPGYVRRSVILGETILGGGTAGVRSQGIFRSEDAALTSQRRAVSSELAQSGVLASTWQSISTRLGDTAEGTGLFSTFSNFESALSNLVISPESGADASAVMSSARSLVQELHGLSAMVGNLRSEADREINDGVTIVNAALEQIAELNGKIAGSNRTSSQAAALIDERGRVLDTIAEYLPIQTVERNSGTIEVLTEEGVFLVAGTARKIDFDPSNAFSPAQTLANGALSGLSVDGVEITPGSLSYGAVSSGLFGALFSLRDNDLPSFSAQLDTFAEDLVTRLSESGIDPATPSGAPGLFVDPGTSGTSGLAGRIRINGAVDPEQGGELWRLRDGLAATSPGPTGDASILQRMQSALTSVNPVNSNGLQGSFSSTELIAHITSLTGQTRVQHASVLSSTTTQYSILSEAEQASSGVDIDAQMQDLLLIEQAYAANARVIEIASQMINRLMEI